MATLRYSQIRAHPGGTINYIANKDKMISGRVHDVANVLNYMGEPESSERVYSFARHCSTNPALASKQMELYRAKYYESKNGAVQGLEDGKEELLGLHFFMSYTEDDDPSEETMNEITAKLAEHPLLKDFPVFGANHFDKAHKHSHFYACQYSAEGKPRKMCMRHDDYNDLRKYANHLCVEHGLSIIDLETLRHNDPEYSAWVDGVIAEGRITVHPERDEHKGAKRQKASTQEIYYKWLKETEEFNLEEERRLTAEQLSKKKAKERYFWNFCKKDEPQKFYPVTGMKNKYYTVRIYDEFGRKRTLLELSVMLVALIIKTELKQIDPADLEYRIVCTEPLDYKVQQSIRAVNALATARLMQIENPDDIPARIADVGKQMNALKREKARHENSIKRHEEIIAAWEVYERVRPFVEGVCEPDPADLDEYKSAYAVLASNQILTAEAFQAFHARYLFEARKVGDYEKRLPELNKQYRDLKHLEYITSRPANLVDEIYQIVNDASQSKTLDIDDMIKAAEAKKAAPKTVKAKGDDLLER